ncbi:MAG TPA: matrixin family metalloprotease [Gemmatimonadales bacterium]|jgi:hypothetical protein|nr:matrixin family metalloprotease [Gemmatimonadales bacterium]
MPRVLLWVLIILISLIALDKINHLRPRTAPSDPVATGTLQHPGPASGGSTTPNDSTASGPQAGSAPVGPSSLDHLARLAIRRRLREEGADTYIDSLLLVTDSLIRRWPDPQPITLKYALIEGGVDIYSGRMADFVREAFGIWEGSGIRVRFQQQADTAGAQITVRWIDHFSFERTGQTDLTWDQFGVIRSARIQLAVRDRDGRIVPDQGLRTVVLHEVGHALGLPHSANPADVMFSSTRASAPTPRDLRTAQLLYQLPPGDVRDR